MENLRTQKDNLAKLMATENLTIVHRKIPTAYFDIKNRVLACPILKDDISPELYDLFMGHEVSHALHTPFEGLHSTLKENRTLKGYLNVVEDVRIEKMIKEKYAGLRKSFFKAYNELMNMDFFSLKGRNLQELSLIDKINLLTKVGSRVNIKLTDKEQEFLDWSYRCQTWEDVVECATAIYEYSKENETRTKEDEEIKGSFEYDIEESDDEVDLGEEDYPFEPYTGEEDDDIEESDIELDETQQSTVHDHSAGSQFDDEDGAREALTEYNAHENEDTLYSTENRIRTQIDLRKEWKEVKNQEVIVPNKEFNSDWSKFWNSPTDDYSYRWGAYSVGDGYNLAKKTSNIIELKNKKTVMHMVKEFEMRQSAAISAKAYTGKTGQLDMNRLAKYQIVDDVFKRAVYLPEGKNHGITVLIDWSGSISNVVPDLLEQAIILTMFCRKAQIPHRVYLFTDSYGKRDLGMSTNLIEIFSNEQSSRDYKQSLLNVSALYNAHAFSDRGWRGYEKFKAKWEGHFKEALKVDDSTRWVQIPHFVQGRYHLGGTPLDASLVYLRETLPKFNKQYSIEKSILTVITDGESHSSRLFSRDKVQEQIQDQTVEGTNHYTPVEIEIIDPYNNKVYPIVKPVGKYNGSSNFRTTQHILEWISKSCNVSCTGYFIGTSRNDFYHIYDKIREDSRINSENHSYMRFDEWYKVAKKEGQVANIKGYNKMFITSANLIKVDDEDTLDDKFIGATKTSVLAAFKRNRKSKTTSRFLTNEFIKEIS